MNRPRKGLSTPLLLGVIGALTIFWLFFVPTGFEESVKRTTGVDVSPRESPVSVITFLDNGKPAWQQVPKYERPPNDNRQTTIVSAFFDLSKQGQKTKHYPAFYLEAGIDGVLSFDSLMIFFTDSPEAVRAVHAKHAPPTARLHIVNISLTEFDVVKSHLKRVNQLVRRDMEANLAGYSGILYMIYHAKPEMMRLAAEMNPFRTDKFLWMDVACVRNWGGIKATDFRKKRFPDPKLEQYIGRDDKIILGAVAGNDGPCTNHVRWVEPGGERRAIDPASKFEDPLLTEARPFNWWIAGAIWGGRGKDMVEYERLYRDALKRYLQKELNDYSLIDQYLMGALACSSNMIEVVRPPPECCVDRVNRKWFFMLMFLTDKPYPLEPYAPGEARLSDQPCMYCKKTN